jgi:IMP dehydrogenase
MKKSYSLKEVFLVPKYSEIAPSEVDLSTRLTAGIKLNLPIAVLGAECRTAIAAARMGGIAFIRAESIEKQAAEADKVKRSENGVIDDPFYLSPNNYIYEADELMAKYHISGVPVTENDRLIGIITNRDIRFEPNRSKKIYEVMTKENLITAPVGTTINKAAEILKKYKLEKLPIVDDKFLLKGLITIKDIEKSIKYPNSAKDAQGRLFVGAVVPAENYANRLAALREVKIDIALAENASLVKKIKEKFPDQKVLAGFCAEGKGAAILRDAGADCVKIGAKEFYENAAFTGARYGAFSAIAECAQAGVPIVADAGIKTPGDATKALAAGAAAAVVEVGNETEAYRILSNFYDGMRAGTALCGAKNLKELRKAEFTT